MLSSAAPAEARAKSSSTSLEATVERLAATEDIKKLRYRFSRAIDNRDWPGLGATLTDDAAVRTLNSVDSDAPPRITADVKGRDNVVNFIRNLVGERMRTIHLESMPDIEFQGKDKAHAKWWIEGYADFSKADEASRARMKGKSGVVFETLEEDYVKIGDKWLIQRAEAALVGNY
ncbi:MAG: nuclear transport factor 2 family protein [Sphingobium sp.]